MSVNIKQNNQLLKVAGNVDGDVLNTLNQIEANTDESAIAGLYQLKN